MKKTKINNVYDALNESKYEIQLNEDIISRARKSLEKMLEYS